MNALHQITGFIKVSVMLFLLTAYIFISTGFADSYLDSSLEIINGVPANDDPMAHSVVGLFQRLDAPETIYHNIWLQWCTGTLLQSKVILTAAHCVKDSKPENLLINFSGKTVTMENQLNAATRIEDMTKVFEIRHVSAVEVHPEYIGHGNGDHDLALLFLSDEAPQTSIPVTLLPNEYLNFEKNQTTLDGQNFPIFLMGYGYINEQPLTSTEVLRSTVVPGTFDKQFVVTDQTQGSGGCNGDSGGPAFLKVGSQYFQVGVTHGPHGESTTCHETGEWVNPALEAKFIEEVLKKLNP